MILTHCTLTGVDETTPLDEIASLSHEFPLVEWGFLYSPQRHGTPGRYPSVWKIEAILCRLPPHVRVALHVCGNGVPALLNGGAVERGIFSQVAERGGRVQLNFSHDRNPVDLDLLASFMHDNPLTTIITQGNISNIGVAEGLAERGVTNHAVLFDASCGKGIAREEWPDPLQIACGYAGGLGPDNLGIELEKIAIKVGEGTTWVDMENRIRIVGEDGVDRFNLDACRACLEAVDTFTAKSAVPVA